MVSKCEVGKYPLDLDLIRRVSAIQDLAGMVVGRALSVIWHLLRQAYMHIRNYMMSVLVSVALLRLVLSENTFSL